MFKSKKIIALSMTILISLSLVGCAGGDTAETTQMQAGDYMMDVEGKEAMEIKVVLSEDSIEEIDIISQNETVGVADDALVQMPENIIENQKVDVDTISGATYTSNAIRESVALAIEEAGGELSDFSDGDIEKPEDVKAEINE